MFDVYCAGHESNVLLTTRQIERLENSPEGITVDWRCWCGTTGRLIRAEPAPTAPAERTTPAAAPAA